MVKKRNSTKDRLESEYYASMIRAVMVMERENNSNEAFGKKLKKQHLHGYVW